MQIATWNVNSLRARMPRVLEFLERRRPDIVCLQETKVEDHLFPREELEGLGYNLVCHGQKTYNGVAILALQPIEDVVLGLPDDHEARVIGATIGGVMVLDLYVVNGRSVGDPKYMYKLDWLERVEEFVRERYDMGEKVILTGDFNVTFDDRDVYDPEAWRERILCTTLERDALASVMSVGLSDAFRKFHDDAGHYTWWDFRTRGYQRGNGLRIDHFLMSPPALAACTEVRIDVELREGAKPSDHAPVLATLED